MAACFSTITNCGHSSLTVLHHSNHPLLCSFRIRQLSVSTAYRRAYICPCDSPIFHTPGNVKNTIFKEKKGVGRSILTTTALIIYVRGIISKCYFCVSIYCVSVLRCLFQSQSFKGQVIIVHDQRDGHFLQRCYGTCKQSEGG